MWNFPDPLVKGRLLSRYKRFFADIELEDGTKVTAHCPNTGSMKSCWNVGDEVYLSRNSNPNRKLAFTWELVRSEKGFVGVNTMRPNQVLEALLKARLVPELASYTEIRREVPYGNENSRVDFLLGSDCYVEVKNTTLLVDDSVAFPDSVSERGQKHLRELSLIAEHSRAVLFFFVNRPEGSFFRPADEIDPEYGTAFRLAEEKGVELLAYRVLGSPTGYSLVEKLPIMA